MITDRAYTVATQTLIAATMIYEAERKKFDACCWVDKNAQVLDAARAAAHAALDAMLDAQQVQIEVLKRQQEGGALLAQQ